MKRKLIITGNQATGKTHLTDCIKQLFGLHRVLRIDPYEFFSAKVKFDFAQYDLIIIEGCTPEQIKQIGMDWKLTGMPVVFTTQEIDLTVGSSRNFNIINL